MNKRIKAIIIVLALLISLCIPVMAVDANTSSINTSSVSSYTEETQEDQFCFHLHPELPVQKHT